MATRKPKKILPSKRPVPAYMMSYGDMMTLLLTFFILLVSLAKEQRAGLVAAGTGSFVHALDSLGLPGMLPGTRAPIRKGQLHPNFAPVPGEVEPDPTTRVPSRELIAARDPRIRRAIIESLQQSRGVALPVPVTFRPGSADLLPESRKALDDVADLAQQSVAYIGIESFVATDDDGWTLSALRAAAIARYLNRRSGIAFRRITTAGYGRFHPVAAARGARNNERINVFLSRKPIY